jgi:hypothetical protein
MLLSHHQEEGENLAIKIGSGCFEKFGTVQIFGNESNRVKL